MWLGKEKIRFPSFSSEKTSDSNKGPMVITPLSTGKSNSPISPSTKNIFIWSSSFVTLARYSNQKKLIKQFSSSLVIDSSSGSIVLPSSFAKEVEVSDFIKSFPGKLIMSSFRYIEDLEADSRPNSIQISDFIHNSLHELIKYSEENNSRSLSPVLIEKPILDHQNDLQEDRFPTTINQYSSSLRLAILPTPLSLPGKLKAVQSFSKEDLPVKSIQSSAAAIASAFVNTHKAYDIFSTHGGIIRLLLFELGEVKHDSPFIIDSSQAYPDGESPIEKKSAATTPLSIFVPQGSFTISNSGNTGPGWDSCGSLDKPSNASKSSLSILGDETLLTPYSSHISSVDLRIESSQGDFTFGYRELDIRIVQDWFATLAHLPSFTSTKVNDSINPSIGIKLWNGLSTSVRQLVILSMKTFRHLFQQLTSVGSSCPSPISIQSSDTDSSALINGLEYLLKSAPLDQDRFSILHDYLVQLCQKEVDFISTIQEPWILNQSTNILKQLYLQYGVEFVKLEVLGKDQKTKYLLHIENDPLDCHTDETLLDTSNFNSTEADLPKRLSLNKVLLYHLDQALNQYYNQGLQRNNQNYKGITNSLSQFDALLLWQENDCCQGLDHLAETILKERVTSKSDYLPNINSNKPMFHLSPSNIFKLSSDALIHGSEIISTHESGFNYMDKMESVSLVISETLASSCTLGTLGITLCKKKDTEEDNQNYKSFLEDVVWFEECFPPSDSLYNDNQSDFMTEKRYLFNKPLNLLLHCDLHYSEEEKSLVTIYSSRLDKIKFGNSFSPGKSPKKNKSFDSEWKELGFPDLFLERYESISSWESDHVNSRNQFEYFQLKPRSFGQSSLIGQIDHDPSLLINTSFFPTETIPSNPMNSQDNAFDWNLCLVWKNNLRPLSWYEDRISLLKTIPLTQFKAKLSHPYFLFFSLAISNTGHLDPIHLEEVITKREAFRRCEENSTETIQLSLPELKSIETMRKSFSKHLIQCNQLLYFVLAAFLLVIAILYYPAVDLLSPHSMETIVLEGVSESNNNMNNVENTLMLPILASQSAFPVINKPLLSVSPYYFQYTKQCAVLIPNEFKLWAEDFDKQISNALDNDVVNTFEPLLFPSSNDFGETSLMQTIHINNNPNNNPINMFDHHQNMLIQSEEFHHSRKLSFDEIMTIVDTKTTSHLNTIQPILKKFTSQTHRIVDMTKRVTFEVSRSTQEIQLIVNKLTNYLIENRVQIWNIAQNQLVTIVMHTIDVFQEINQTWQLLSHNPQIHLMSTTLTSF